MERTSSNFDLGSRQGSSMVLAGYLGSTASSPEGQWANVAQPDLSSSLNVPNPHRNFLKSVTPKFLSLSPQRFRLNVASRSYVLSSAADPTKVFYLLERPVKLFGKQSDILPKMIFSRQPTSTAIDFR